MMPMSTRHTNRDSLFCGLSCISPWLIGFIVFMLAPIVISGGLSLCQFDGIRAPVLVGVSNWRGVAADPLFWKVLANTLIYTAVALPAGTVFALSLALILNARMPGRTLWRALVFAPTLVPLVAVGIIWAWMFNARHGLVNVMLESVGIEGPNWLADPRWTMPSMVLLGMWSIGHTVIIYLAGLQNVPRELYEAANLDGAGSWHRLWNVTLPMISPTIFFNLIVGIIFVWQIFAVPYVMLPGGGPGRNAYFYSVYLYDLAFTYRRFGYACTLSWIQLVIILSLTAVVVRFSRRWVYYRGAVK